MSHHFVSQIIHVVWSTKNLEYLISQPILNLLYAYLATVIKSKGGKLYLAGGTSDHIHCLLDLPPDISLSSLMNILKSFSSKWLKHRETIDSKFAWQDGYTAFTVQKDRIQSVCKYIQDDASRHEHTYFKDELINLLKMQGIPYNETFFLNNTHSKILLHIIWSTKNRTAFLDKAIRPTLYQYLSDTLTKGGSLLHAIGGIEDHVHLLIETARNKALGDILKEAKTSSNHWISKYSSQYSDFSWQIGYGAFSLSLNTYDAVIQYIAKQEEHHKFVTPQEEWNTFLNN